jgi:DNA-binding winged helix-turn-helix (wHTH) protein/tetratricopeptide (TPR) repeat protein
MRNPTPESTADLTGRRWSFGPAVLDERSLELEVGGQQVKLERKPLEVLLYLLHHAGEVVTKDDLAESLWPGRILTETVLTRCISLLRTGLQDDGRTLIRTVHGFGYRLVADVRVELAPSTAGPPALEFRVGDHPPSRPQWKLVERLGTGGHGEAWLARHEKTGDARVFKFAVNAGALTSLKREITLYRLLHDSLGARAAVARILEWNLTESPYFIEVEHVAGGNLQAWSEAQGGLTGIPLPARLELVARIAEAVAAAHSVGALHKDLKPGNVLVHVENGMPVIRLCDFGSGGVLDPQRLDALGITRHGFTKTMADATTSATPLYIAPEVIAGQPFTIQADIYSLGILLYQVVAGDLRKALAPGWESDIEDELLREDIGLAAAGNPSKRLTDAAQLAERLRSLEARREARAAEVAAQQRTDRAHRALQELRRVRVYAGVLFALAAVAVAGGILAYRARNEAVAATATAKAVSDFLMEDVFRVDSGVFKPSEASYEALLDRAAREVSTRLREQPKAAASIHSLLGRRYQEIGRVETAMTQYEQAVALFADLYGESAEPTLMALDRLAWIYVENGRSDEALVLSERMQALWESQLPANDLAMLMVRIHVARVLLTVGKLDAGERGLRTVILDAQSADSSTERVAALFKQWLGITSPPDAGPKIITAYANLLLAGILEEIDEGHLEAETRLREALSTFSTVLGQDSELRALASYTLAAILATAGETDEAEKHALEVQRILEKSLPPRHYAHGLSRSAMAKVRLEQRRVGEAVDLLKDSVQLCSVQPSCPPRVQAFFLWELGTVLNEGGHNQAAAEALHLAIELQEKLGWPDHVLTLRARVALVDALRKGGKAKEASAALAAISKTAVARLRPHQQAKADLRRAEGLLLLQRGERSAALAALQESFEIVNRRLGATHWRTRRARSELAAALPPENTKASRAR